MNCSRPKLDVRRVHTDERGRTGFGGSELTLLLESMGFLEAVAAAAPPATPVRTLEVGAGTGKFTTAFTQFLDAEQQQRVALTAVEPSELVSACPQLRPRLRRDPRAHTFRQRHHLKETFGESLEVVQALADDVPFADSSFDFVLCAQAFHWFSTHSTVQEVSLLLCRVVELHSERRGSGTASSNQADASAWCGTCATPPTRCAPSAGSPLPLPPSLVLSVTCFRLFLPVDAPA